LAWLYEIDHKHYSNAAKNALQHGQRRVGDIDEAKTIFSIAKLAARLSDDETKNINTSDRYTDKLEDSDETGSNSSKLEAERNLALLKAQLVIQEILPR
jgi:hypothetical protein